MAAVMAATSAAVGAGVMWEVVGPLLTPSKGIRPRSRSPTPAFS
jgi:hypothetical protein